MLILALDAAAGRCLAALVEDDRVLASESDAQRLAAGQLAAMVDLVLQRAAIAPAAPAALADLAAIAVTIGPGSFTGIRAALAVAHGMALGGNIPLVGVSVGAALRAALAERDAGTVPGQHLGGRAIWAALEARAGHVVIETAQGARLYPVTEIPTPEGPIALAGNASRSVGARLAARGADIMLTNALLPDPLCLAALARAQLESGQPPPAAMPLYVEEPLARAAG